MSALRVRCWPGAKTNVSRSASGTAKRIDLASAVSGTTSAMRRVWKETLIRGSMAFKQVEGLRAEAAAPQGLARGRAEAADLLRLRRAALRAVHGALARGVGRGDAIGTKLVAALGRDPVGGPWRAEGGLDANILEADGVERVAHHPLDDLGGRAAGIGRGQHHSVVLHLADD